MKTFDKSPAGSFDVLIVGGGPCGLSAAIALGRCGVRTLLVEKHASTSFHPRGHVVSARTMEIFRGWGIEEAVRARGIPHDRNQGIAFARSLAGELIGQIVTGGDRERNRVVGTYSPGVKTSCPQDVLEPVLRRAAESELTVSVRFGASIDSLAQDDEGVEARVTSGDGTSTLVRARYAIAADGARGGTRDALGIGMTGHGDLGNQIGVYFEADLWPWVSDRPNLLWWIYNKETVGVMIALDGRRRWTYNFGYDPAKSQPEDFTPQRCADIVRCAVGVPDLQLQVRDVRVWRMQARIAETLRCGRIFIAGDAAHPLPPTGGQGMNTAVGDVHNLAWKLALVVNGLAEDRLLDTYEQERLPVIQFNVEQSVRNARKMGAAGLGGIMKTSEDFREEDIPRMREAIPHQREHFEYHGQTFGYVYRSDVVFDEGAEPAQPSINTYEPSGMAGARAPHCWLVTPAGQTISTIDLFRDMSFTLLAGREGAPWQQAFRRCAGRVGLEGQALRIGPDGDLVDHHGAFLELYGIGPQGAVLVRPDGHVAWRTAAALRDPETALTHVLRTITTGDARHMASLQKEERAVQ